MKPIEDIKVGDYVLSKPESGEGELCYQPVTRTYEYENRELYYVVFGVRKELPEGEKPAWDHGCIAVTGGHPIWIDQLEFFVYSSSISVTRETEEVHEWMSVEDLHIRIRDDEFNLKDNHIGKALRRVYAKLEDGRAAVITTISPILKSEGRLSEFGSSAGRFTEAAGEIVGQPDIGVAFRDWPGWEEDNECCGQTLCFGKEGVRDYYCDPSISMTTSVWQIDTDAYDYSGYDTESEMSVVRRSGGYLPIRRKVYNLEVANTHTYFVTQWGL